MKNINKQLFEDVSLLYVEDDEMTLEEISYFLKKYIKKLYIAKDGEEGLELYKKYKPDIVITDVQMPKMNGLEMSEKILELNPNAPIVITTAYSDGEYLIRAIELKIDKYLLKPINMIDMLTVIQKSLGLDAKVNSAVVNYECEDYVKFILDSNPTFMLILHSDRIKFINKSLLELLGHDNISSLNQHIENFKDLFILENTQTDENWVDYVTKNNDTSHIVTLKASKNNLIKSKFNVTYKYFESTDKSVFVFIDTNSEKLNKINTIVKKLLKNKTYDDINIDDLQQIAELSSN